MWCAIYLPIFVTTDGGMNGFGTWTYRGIGGRGSRRSTGTDIIIGTGTGTIIGTRYEVATTVGGGKTTTAGLIVGTKYGTSVMIGGRKATRAV